MRVFLILFFVVFFCTAANALVVIDSSTTFPYSATSSNETYQLSENISCETSCISLSGDNSIIDLNGHTMTFGTANAVTVQNSDFENWTGSVPDNWTVISGAVSSVSAIDWGSYDLQASSSFTIRSDSFSLTSGQTYQAWAFVKSSSSASAVLRVLNAADNSVLATLNMTGGQHLSRGFAVYGAADNALTYKPASSMSVKLELECSGTYSFRVAEVTMAPFSHYGVFTYSYQNVRYFPDMSGVTFGTAPGSKVINGTITQGAGQASYSSGLFNVPRAESVTINISGPNSGGAYNPGEGIYNVTVNNTSRRVFNRMYGDRAAGVSKLKGWNTALVIDGLTVNNYPQYGFVSYNCPTTYDNGGSLEIKNSAFHGDALVTEPYAIGLSGVKNLNIHDNDISPMTGKGGRGFLIDAVGCVDPQVEGATGSIYDNTITGIYEDGNFEYESSSLESVGVRIRNWGGDYEGHQLSVHDNTISAYTNSAGSHAAYGININASSNLDELTIYNNTITVTKADADQFVAGIALQSVGNQLTDRIVIRNNDITSNSYGIVIDANDGVGTENAEIKYNKIVSSESSIVFGAKDYSNYSQDLASAAVTDIGGGIVGISVSGSCPKVGRSFGITGTTNYNGVHTISSTTTSGVCEFPATYIAETTSSAGKMYITDYDVDIFCNDLTNNNSTGYILDFDGSIYNILIDYNRLTNSNSSGYEAWTDENRSTEIITFGNGTIDVTGGGSIGSAGSATNGANGCWSLAGTIGEPPAETGLKVLTGVGLKVLTGVGCTFQ